MLRKKPKGVTVADISDAHSGSTMGLMYPKEYQFYDGNKRPTAFNEMIWTRFEEYTATIAEKRKGNILIVRVAGDPLDGNHHGTHQLITPKLNEQRELFSDAFDYFLRKVGYDASKGDQIYMINGTELRETHGTTQTTSDIGKDFGAVPYRPPSDPDALDPDDPAHNRKADGWYAWQFLALDIRGHLFEIAHHPAASLGKRAHTKGNAIRSWARSMQHERVARGMKIPRFSNWGHVHTAHVEPVYFDNGTPVRPLTEVVVLPCFQLPTEYVDQTNPYRLPTTIGGWWATVSADGAQVDHGLDYVEFDARPEPVKI